MRRAFPFVALLLPAALAGQSAISIRTAVQSIRPADVVRRIGILADDSMLGRATPSPQLDEVAGYIASEFRRFGLRPGGDNGSFIQRYPVSSVLLDTARSEVEVTDGAGAVRATWRLGRDVLYYRGAIPPGDVSAPLVLVTGEFADSLRPDSTALSGKVVAFVRVGGSATLQRVIGAARPAAMLLAATLPPQAWAREAEAQARPRILYAPGQATSPPTLLVRETALLSVLAEAGVSLDTATARAAPFRVVELGRVARVRLRRRGGGQLSAPNVIGILDGSDPLLRREYVVFSGHMDHIGTPGAGEGCEARGGDSICNGADDDASGTTAVIELAQAFARLRPRPRRSLLFLTVSGEERGLWGSTYFVDHPPVSLESMVADLNTDMVGRNWKDTIAVIGREQSDLGATLERVAAAHPELHMTPVGDLWPQEGFYFRSDHFNFAHHGVPILFFFNGTHPDYHQVSDAVAKIDGEKESRIVKLDFYLGLDVANAAARPRWDPASYRRIVTPGN